MFTLVRLKVAEIAGNDDFQKVFGTAEIRKRHENMTFRIEMLFAEIDEVNRIVHMFQHIAHDHEIKLFVFGVLFVKHVVVFVKTARNLVNRMRIGAIFRFNRHLVSVFRINYIVQSGASTNFKDTLDITGHQFGHIITRFIPVHKNLFCANIIFYLSKMLLL